MSQENVLKINRLPAPTWNWLRMNGSQTTVGEGLAEGRLEVEKPESILDVQGKAAIFDSIETGMGQELDAYVKQNMAVMRVLECPAGVTEEKPVRLHFAYGAQAGAVNRIGLLAGEGSTYTVIMDFTGERDGAGQAVVQTKLSLGRNACIRLVQIQRLGSQVTFLNDVGADCGENAQVELVQLVLGGHETYMGSRTELGQQGSALTCEIGYLLDGDQKLDMNYVASHTAKKTHCDINASGVLRDKAFKLFRGTIDFRRGSAGSKGNEKEDVLLMSDGVVNQTIPLILCEEEDVEGNHGATIGKLDEDLLFYLESRGIGQDEVYEMLARAKIDAVCRRIPDARTVEEIQDYLGRGVSEEEEKTDGK